MRQHPGVLALAPRLPAGVTRLRFRIRHSGLRLRVDADHDIVQLRTARRLRCPVAGAALRRAGRRRRRRTPRAGTARASAARRTSPRLMASPSHDTSGDVT
ncbi:glycosyl hydrolase family 65 protein [Micromonospora inaquosa]|uniref:glycosyl hydrolase family 65 protein n=1 Tax=Micromonospora inaquosa TaxID=2203716 RepID=UPI003CC60886